MLTISLNQSIHPINAHHGKSGMHAEVFVDTNIWVYAHLERAWQVAAALGAGCGLLYSEDMQSGQLIEGTLTILNPLL